MPGATIAPAAKSAKRRVVRSGSLPSARRTPSDLELLRDAGEAARAGRRHERHVLDPHPAEAEVVEARLHGHHVASPQDGRPLADRGCLVDLQADAVARAVEEALHAPV